MCAINNPKITLRSVWIMPYVYYAGTEPRREGRARENGKLLRLLLPPLCCRPGAVRVRSRLFSEFVRLDNLHPGDFYNLSCGRAFRVINSFGLNGRRWNGCWIWSQRLLHIDVCTLVIGISCPTLVLFAGRCELFYRNCWRLFYYIFSLMWFMKVYGKASNRF